METKRCIFCMQEIDSTEERCPHCKKAVWEYGWKPGWIRPYTVLQERYMIGQALGEGAFGVTYLAYAKKEITVQNATEEDKKYLDMKGFDMIVVVKSYTYLDDTSLFQYTESRHRPDKFVFVDFARRH